MSLPIRTMRAAILAESGKDLIIDEVHLPEKLEAGQVLVKMAYSGICGSQIGEIDAVKGPDRYLPHLLGHEGSGEVLAVGPGVRHLQVGETVILHWRPGRGIEAMPPHYLWNNKPLNAGWVTTFNDYAIVSENRCTAVPHHLQKAASRAQLALLGCAVTTALGCLSHEARLMPGENIAVLGVGGVGQAMIQGAKLMGAASILAIDIHPDKLDLAEELGATHVLDGAESNLEQDIKELLGPLDIVVDNTGRSELISLAYQIAAPQGRIMLVGVPSPQDPVQLDSLPLHFGKKLLGSHGGSTLPHKDIPRYLRLCQHNKLDLDALISEVVSLEQINDAIQRLRQGEVAGRSLIAFDSEWDDAANVEQLPTDEEADELERKAA